MSNKKENHKDGDTLSSNVEVSLQESVNAQIAPLKRKAEGLISTIDSAILVVSAIFNKKARTDLDSSFASIRGSLEAFERTMENVNDMVDARKKANKIDDASKKAKAYCDKVIPFFETIRYSTDKLELVIDNKTWPLPKYREMLFIK